MQTANIKLRIHAPCFFMFAGGYSLSDFFRYPFTLVLAAGSMWDGLL